MEQEQPAKSVAERWFEEQQAWQKTMRQYADAMAKDEDFLMHLGNAMRGSLLAGAPYPEPNPAAEAPKSPAEERIDEILFLLKQIDGRLRDIEADIEDLRSAAQSARSSEVDGSV